MDYEYYHVDEAWQDYDEQERYICALYLYDETTPPIRDDYENTIWQLFNLFYGVDPKDGCWRWQLHYPYIN